MSLFTINGHEYVCETQTQIAVYRLTGQGYGSKKGSRGFGY